MRIFTNANYNFTRWRWHALILSLVIVIAGAAMIVSRGGLPLGIDFSGGTLVVVGFDQDVTEDRIRQALDSVPGDETLQQYGDPGDRRWLIRLPQVETVEQGANLEVASERILAALRTAGL